MRTFGELLRAKPLKLLQLNVAFLLGCLPALTAPAAVCALNEVLVHYLRDGDMRPFPDFFRALTKGFWGYCKAGYTAALPMGALGLMAAYLYPQIWLSAWSAIFFIAVCILLALLCIASVYYFPMAGGVEIPLPALVKNAFLLGALHIKKSIPLALLLALVYALEARLFPYSAPVIALLGAVLPSLFSVCVAWPGILAAVVEHAEAPAETAQAANLPPRSDAAEETEARG